MAEVHDQHKDLAEKDPRFTGHVEQVAAISDDEANEKGNNGAIIRDWTPEEERKIV